MSEYGGDLEIVRLSAIVLSMLAESECMWWIKIN